MNKNLIRYFDRQLSAEESARMESELSRSPRLQEQYASLLNTQQQLDQLKVAPPMDAYFAEARGRFRANMEAKKGRSLFSQYALAGSGVFTLTIMLFLSVSTSIFHFEQPVADMASNKSGVVDEISIEKAEVPSADSFIADDAKTGDVLQKKLHDETGIRPENSDKLMQDMDMTTDELVANLQTDEIEPVLNKLK